MPMLDIFENDAFSVTGLTAAIMDQPHLPGRFGELGLFNAEGINTTSFAIESVANTLSLVTSAVRGAPGAPTQTEKRSLRNFGTVHLPQRATVMADEVLGVRAFGSESELQSVQSIVNRHLARLRRNIDATLEWQRIGAVKGIVYDADGSTELLNVYSAFGQTQTDVDMNLDVTTTDVRDKCLSVELAVETALGGIPYTGIRVFCGEAFWRSLVNHDDVKTAFDRWNSGEFLRNDPLAAFEFGGISWERYRGNVSSQAFIATNDAYAVPLGIPDLFITRFAPADYLETVNTNGLPYYAKQERMQFDKGIEIEAQSNTISLCTRPKAVIKLNRTS